MIALEWFKSRLEPVFDEQPRDVVPGDREWQNAILAAMGDEDALRRCQKRRNDDKSG